MKSVARGWNATAFAIMPAFASAGARISASKTAASVDPPIPNAARDAAEIADLLDTTTNITTRPSNSGHKFGCLMMWSIQYPVTNHGRKTAPLAKQSHKTSTRRTLAESPCAPQLASMLNGDLNPDKSCSLFRMISHTMPTRNLGSPKAHQKRKCCGNG